MFYFEVVRAVITLWTRRIVRSWHELAGLNTFRFFPTTTFLLCWVLVQIYTDRTVKDGVFVQICRLPVEMAVQCRSWSSGCGRIGVAGYRGGCGGLEDPDLYPGDTESVYPAWKAGMCDVYGFVGYCG